MNRDLFAILCMLGVAGSFTLGLDYLGVDTANKPLTTEIDFRSACAKVNGSTVWTGRQWGCLK